MRDEFVSILVAFGFFLVVVGGLGTAFYFLPSIIRFVAETIPGEPVAIIMLVLGILMLGIGFNSERKRS